MSHNLEGLPNSITKLLNLQTLILNGCKNINELPNDIYKLVDLTILDISFCFGLRHVPSNLGMLTNLGTLGQCVVGGESSYEKQCFDGLKVLHSLNSLKGYLRIDIKVFKNADYNKENYGGGAYLMSKEYLSKIAIVFEHMEEQSIDWEQSLLEDMQPHENTKELCLEGYNCETMSRWPSKEDHSTLFNFPNLVNLTISDCQELRLLPSLENLPHLTTLELWILPNVEYIVNINMLEALSLAEGISFFPCLKSLSIGDMPKFKGWWPGSSELPKIKEWKEGYWECIDCFAQLRKVYIENCPMMKIGRCCGTECGSDGIQPKIKRN